MSKGESKLAKTLAKPALVGAVAAIASAVLFNGTGSVSTPLGTLPVLVPMAVSVGAASYAAEIGKNYLIPDKKDYQTAASIAKPLLTGAASVVASMALVGTSNVNPMPMFIMGAGSELAGDYAYNNVISPYLSDKKVV